MRLPVSLPIFLLMILLAGLAGCIHPLSRQVRQNVDPALTTAMVSDNPGAHIDRYLILGGVILNHVREGQGSTLEIMEWHINRWGEPEYLEDDGIL